jgi:hypothetical protein
MYENGMSRKCKNYEYLVLEAVSLETEGKISQDPTEDNARKLSEEAQQEGSCRLSQQERGNCFSEEAVMFTRQK